MSFPLLNGERSYVLIVRGDGFPCGSRPWVQLVIGFANHGQKARTLAYNWTIDVALTSEHDIDALRAIFSMTLEAIQSIINTRWILIREKWCRARVMLGGHSPWLHKMLGISSYFCTESIYTYATWCAVKGKWEDRKWWRSPKSDKKLYKLHKKGLDCTTAKGCVSEPLLHIEEQFKFVVMGDGGKSVQPSPPKKKKSAKASVPQPQEGPKQDPKEEESPNEAGDDGTPHANEPAAPEKATFATEV